MSMPLLDPRLILGVSLCPVSPLQKSEAAQRLQQAWENFSLVSFFFEFGSFPEQPYNFYWNRLSFSLINVALFSKVLFQQN
jgi:hypothetical protein